VAIVSGKQQSTAALHVSLTKKECERDDLKCEAKHTASRSGWEEKEDRIVDEINLVASVGQQMNFEV
jgi:hypothetical protein